MRLLALPDLRLVWLAAVVSWSGDALSFLAFMWLAYDVGGATGVVVVRLADSIPSVVVGLLAGVVADRVERRRLMVGADLFRAAVLVLLVSVTAAGQPTVFALAMTMFLIRIGDAFFEPAAGAILPDLVETSALQRANALFQATSDALSALGMGAAGILLAVLPLVHFFTLDMLSFVASAGLLSLVATRSVAQRAEHEAPLAELTGGVRELVQRPAIGIATLMFGLGITIGAGMFIPAAPSLVGGRLNDGPGSFGLVMLGFGAGAILAAAVLGRVHVRRKAEVSIVAWVGYSLCFVVFAAAGNLAPLILGAAAAGAAEAVARILLVSAMQEEIPSARLGRAMAVFFTVHRATHGLGLITVAFLVTSLPISEALLIGAGLELAALLVCLGLLRANRVVAPVHGR
jgi:MFS transporter, DHA3 family, macrolide efflux protein